MRLLQNHISQVPATFFTHVRQSIRRLLSPDPEPIASCVYPRDYFIPNTAEVSDARTSWVQSLLQWDARWGYNHWHQFVYLSSGFRVCHAALCSGCPADISQVVWFADPAMREVVTHTLRVRNSPGSFLVMVQQQFPWSASTYEVPGTVETVGFVLTAVCIRLYNALGTDFL